MTSVTADLRPPEIRPSGWWYLAPVLVLVVGSVMAVMSLVNGFTAAQRAPFEANVTAAGESQPLSIPAPGGYTVGYVGPVLVSDDFGKEELADELAISIVDSGTGVPVPLSRYDGYRPQQDVDPNLGPIQYVPLRTVRFDEAGEYVMTSRRSFRLDQRAVLVVSESPYRHLRDGAERAVWLGVISLFLAILGTVILAVNRKRSRRAAAAAGPPPGPPGSGWGAPAPPWGTGPPPAPWAPPGGGTWGPPGQPPPGAWGAPPPGGPTPGPWAAPDRGFPSPSAGPGDRRG